MYHTNKEIAQELAKRRKELGYSYEELARRTGIHRSTLQRYETGEIQNIRLKQLGSLCEGLNCKPEDLLGYESREDVDPELEKLLDICMQAQNKGISPEALKKAIELLEILKIEKESEMTH